MDDATPTHDGFAEENRAGLEWGRSCSDTGTSRQRFFRFTNPLPTGAAPGQRLFTDTEVSHDDDDLLSGVE
jgi:hypothetical protein